MFFKILLLTFVLNVSSSATLRENFFAERTGNAPFFELPCMAVGGVCAVSVACPIGTRVSVKGLCPVQQRHGMECCRPKHSKEVTCMSKGGECLSSRNFKCPRKLSVKMATDCSGKQICCA